MMSPDLPPNPPNPPDAPSGDAAPPVGPPPVRGGWTGLLIVLWAACVSIPTALYAAGLLLVAPFAAVAELRLEELVVEQHLPPEAVLEPAASLADAAVAAASAQQAWALAITALAVVLLITGLRLVAGNERGRRATRLVLVVLVAAIVGAAAHTTIDYLPRIAADAEMLRSAFVELASAVGERFDRGMVDTLFDPTVLLALLWAPAIVVVPPTVLLWFAAGRRTLRAWCV